MAKAKILVVDDDPDILDVVTIILESQDYEVVTARDGEEGLNKLKSEKPQVMILDLLMPKKDGFAVIRELKDPRWSKYAIVPILVLTSIREEAARRRYELETGLELGADDYLEKPIEPAVLLDRVEKLLKKRGTSIVGS